MGGRTLPEAILLEIVVRLPLSSIAKFKSVCKQWKSMIESLYFRHLFVTLHQNSSSSWSLMFQTDYLHPNTEAIGFHGCKTWGLPKSLSSYILAFQTFLNLPTSRYFYVASSNGLVLIEVFITRNENIAYTHKSFVGNPILQQWVEIPPPPEPCKATGLVTCVENDGLVSSFKVVRTCQSRDREMNEWRVFVYSSITGLWTSKRLVHYSASYSSMSLNEMLYLYAIESGVLIAHDFYSEEVDDQCRVIPLPVFELSNKHVKRCLTISRGDVILIQVVYQRLNVWRLDNNNEWWQEINIMSFGFDANCFPVAMNPFDSDILYLWSVQHGCLVLGNLRTQEFIFHQELENCGFCVLNTLDSKRYLESSCSITSMIMLSQFVLPQWMDSIPYPPN